jgi:hypothetical protein
VRRIAYSVVDNTENRIRNTQYPKLKL